MGRVPKFPPAEKGITFGLPLQLDSSSQLKCFVVRCKPPSVVLFAFNGPVIPMQMRQKMMLKGKIHLWYFIGLQSSRVKLGLCFFFFYDGSSLHYNWFAPTHLTWEQAVCLAWRCWCMFCFFKRNIIIAISSLIIADDTGSSMVRDGKFHAGRICFKGLC